MGFILRFIRPLANSQGELRAASDYCPLTQRELEEIAGEVRADYSNLANGEKRVLQVKTRLTSLPAPVSFQVEAEQGPDRRSPTLLLRYEMQAEEPVPVEALLDWPQELARELQRLLQQRPVADLPGADRAALAHAAGELGQLASGAPPTLVIMLLAGYLTLAEQSCKLTGDVLRAAFYALAARGLERVLHPPLRGLRGTRTEEELAALGEGTAAARHLAGLLNLLTRRPVMERIES